MKVKMKMFVLQNRDYSEMFWSTEMGWSDIEHADFFLSSELEDEYAVKLQRETNGRWVLDDVLIGKE